jgi:ketosteroid isomerase-like protein
MNTTNNKETIQHIYACLSDGDSKPLLAAMADETRWHMIGDTRWSGSYNGKQDIIERLLKPLRERFATRYRCAANRIVAEGDMVVAECRGEVRTKDGMDYNNSYCNVFKFDGGKVVEITEYLDTALVDRALP